MLRKELDQAQGLTAQELLPQLPSCIPPASLHLLQEGTQEGGPGQGEGEQDRCPRLPPHPLSHFRVQAMQMEGPVSITAALPAPVALFQRKV